MKALPVKDTDCSEIFDCHLESLLVYGRRTRFHSWLDRHVLRSWESNARIKRKSRRNTLARKVNIALSRFALTRWNRWNDIQTRSWNPYNFLSRSHRRCQNNPVNRIKTRARRRVSVIRNRLPSHPILGDRRSPVFISPAMPRESS